MEINTDNWLQQEEIIDKQIHDYLNEKNWNQFIPATDFFHAQKFRNFHEHIMYVVMKFLHEDDRRELFIQIPIEEFANSTTEQTNLQSETFRSVGGTIMTCLELSTINEVFQSIRLPRDITYRGANNDWYKEGDVFYAEHEQVGKVIIKCYVQNGNRRLKYQHGNQKYNMNNENNFNRCSNICRIERMPAQIAAGCNEIAHDLVILDRLHNCADSLKDYKTATFVCKTIYSPKSTNILFNSRYFKHSVTFENNPHRMNNINAEIIVAYGDALYNNTCQYYRNSNAKKIIYFGSEDPATDIPTYRISYREMYRYCSPRTRLSYEHPKLITIEFPWLTDTMVQLNSLLETVSQKDEFLTDDICKHLRNFIFRELSDIRFCQDTLDIFKNKINDSLLDDILDMNSQEETFTCILNWLKELQFNGTNPKQLYVQKTFLANDIFPVELCKNSSYKNTIKRLTGYSNHVVIDSATNMPNGDDNAKNMAFRYILRYHMFCDVVCLYYPEEHGYLKKIKEFLDKELDVYSCEERIKFNTNIKVNANDTSTELSNDDINLNDYIYEYNDYRIDKYSSYNRDGDSVTITFTDGTTTILNGDFLIKGVDNTFIRESTQNIDSVQEGSTIFYYVNPTNFDYLINQLLGLPEHINMDKYAKLWKTVFRNYVDQKIAEGNPKCNVIGEIARETKIKRDIINNYTKVYYSSKFMQDSNSMKSMCDFLCSKELLTDQEVKYVQALRNVAYEKNSSYGRTIKDEALSYIIDANEECPTLQKLASECHISISELVKTMIKKGTIKKINIQKNK